MKPRDDSPVDDSPLTVPLELGQLERFTRWLIRHAARNSPAALAERLEEEWLAHLASQGGPMARLRFAVGCCWARRVIAHDYLASSAPASSAATLQGTITLGHYDPSYFSRRTVILLLIVGLHGFVMYGFATGFGRKVIEALPGRVQATFLNPPKPTEPLPPPIASSLARVEKPIIPDVPLAFQFPTDSTITERPTPQPPPATSPAAPAKVVTRVVGGPGRGFPSTSDYYPLPEQRLGYMGVAMVQVCVDGRGRLASTPALAHSSGRALLDAAALRVAQAGSGHYRSTTEDGVPVTDCYPFRIRFELKE